MRKLVFWPFENSERGGARFFQALKDGVVPVLISPGIPQEKLTALQREYSGEADARIFFVLLTSGSTGKPKLIAATREAVEKGVQAIHAAQGLEEIHSTAVLLPLSYSYALINQLFWSVHFKRKLIFPPGLASPADSLEMIRQTKAEMLCLIASQVQALQNLGFDEEDALPDVKVVNFAGAPFPVKNFEYLKKIFPRARFFNNYGCTEALPRLTVCEVKSAAHPVSCVGAPIQGIELRISEESDPGPVEFCGPSVSIGEVRPDGSIKEHRGWIRSGDIGQVKEGVLHVFGRYDQVINVRGERISLMEIENFLTTLPEIEHTTAWAETLDNGDQLPMVVLNGRRPPSEEEIRGILTRSLVKNAWPSQLFWAEKWFFTPNGKTDRALLRHMALKGELKLIWRQL